MPEFYKHSGAISIGGLLGGAILGLAAAAGLSIIYSYAIVWIPLIYVNFLLTAGYGIAIGVAVYYAARIGKVRNNAIVAVIGLLCGIVGVYYAWAFDMVARNGDSFTMDPAEIWQYVLAFNEQGAWTIGRNAQQNVTGIFLWIVWFAEAAVIIGAASFMPYFLMSESVFCETCDVWAKNEEGVRKLALDRADEVTARVLAGDVAALRDIPMATDDKQCVRLDLQYCEHCGESNYLSVSRLVTTKNKKGEESTETTELLKHLRIAAADVPHVREAGSPPASPFQPPDAASTGGAS